MATNEPAAPQARDRARSRWTAPIIVIAGLVGAGLGLVAYSVVQSPASSSVTVLINPTVGNPYSPTSDNLTNVQSDAAVVTSDLVVADAAVALGDEVSAASVAGRVGASANTGSQVITITSKGSGEPPNDDVVNEMARAYLDAREATSEETVSAQSTILRSQIKAAEKELTSASKAAARATPGSATALVQESRVRVASESLASLYNALASANSSSTDPGRVLSGTADPQSPSWPWAVAGFVLGAALGFAALQARRT